MKVLLLLAGQSKRFWPLKEKTLFPVCGKTLLAHQVEHLQKGGVKEIILVGNAENLKAAKKLFPKLKGIEQQNKHGGMRAAMLSALPKIVKDPVMVVSGNDLIEHNGYVSLIEASKKKNIAGAILAAKVKRYFPGGYLTIKGGKITGIVEKPKPGKEPSDLVTIVAHVHNDPAALLAELKSVKTKNDDGYEAALASLFKKVAYKAVPYRGVWQPVKYPWHMLSVLELLLKQMTKSSIHRSAQIHKTAVIEGPVILEEGVKVMEHATIKGPVFIGKGSVIGTNSFVIGSSIGQRCMIGFRSDIKTSILCDNIWTHQTYLGDSVVGSNTAFGGGCLTGNFRLDEQEISSAVGEEKISTGRTKCGPFIGSDCRFGIQVGTNPGVKIGQGTFIAGGTFIAEDVPERSFVRMKEGKVVVTENRTSAPKAEDRKRYRT